MQYQTAMKSSSARLLNTSTMQVYTSGDAIMSIPPWRLDRKTIDTITDYSVRIGKALNVKGPFNIQYLIKDEEVLVIEANIRASRSMPFVSKFVGYNVINLAQRQ